MILEENTCIEGIERRGRVYYMRIRVPARFAAVEQKKEINRSLKTRDYQEAKAAISLAKHKLLKEWEASLAADKDASTPEAFDAALAMLRETGVPYRTMEELVTGSVNELLDRVQGLERVAASSAKVPALLGALNYPSVKISEMPPIINELRRARLASMNARQIRRWCTKYLKASSNLVAMLGDKPVLEITESDALTCRNKLQTRCDAKEITIDHAEKQLRHMKQLIEAYFERFQIPPSQQNNPFGDVRISKANTGDREDCKKSALPASWVKHHIIDRNGMEGLNDEAQDIAVISAETGCRQAEIIDLPPEDIHLDHEIPHVEIRVVAEGENKRQIKNKASKRTVVLLGAALEAMRRHPEGFPRYRGKEVYSNTVNKYFRKNDLFPVKLDGQNVRFSMGCTRHTFEDRMIAAKMTNEERAYLMGHSIGSVRGRPVYGSEPDLKLRALLQEIVSFPVEGWKPRSINEIRAAMDALLKENGFRVE
ncbi:MAG: DUF6538 domain-containing protein [Limimaricola soesokkakensis]|uniref:DUF6538 domain-containing protein n=1 Tax=Limimaricola soesokkakensis TaxID=1343159 RepID=UPI004058B164